MATIPTTQTAVDTHLGVAQSLPRAPIVAVVRTARTAEARAVAELFIAAGLELVEVTFTVPGATDLVRELLAARGAAGPPWIGMGTVTTAERARQAVAAGAEYLVSPNINPAVAEIGREHGKYMILGALTATEVVAASELGADLVKVWPLPPVGGPAYLSVLRQPLGDIPMLAGGGYGVEEIPAYRAAGAIAFGIGAPLLGATPEESRRRIARALALARGEGDTPALPSEVR
ncbi:MAG TPA: 2-dehydro-3-deoxyphosphogluconate aldolase [Thermoanaerobaculia bacterium]|nr:2-dehydro-3-deoxyphosphogluconate aldolase [Thermoanaerobaculia bacterium]